MNNGEGARENVAKVASPDPFDKSDGGDVSPASLSQYSSCGESEFERYCSANSVMGTPSMRSSYGASLNDGLDSEFETLMGLGFGDDLSFENFSLGGNRNISTCDDRRIEFQGGRNDEDNNDNNEGLNDDEDVKLNGIGMVSEDNAELVVSAENVLIQENGGNGESGLRNLVIGDEVEDSVEIELRAEEGRCSKRLDLQFGLEFDQGEVEGVEDGTSSRYEHSEDEESIYNYVNDEEHSSNLYYQRNVEYVQEEKRENENPLLINSNIVFGSKDWDDFEQEVGGSTLSSLTLERFSERGESNVESGKNLFGFTSNSPIWFPSGGPKEQGSDVTDAPAISKKFSGVGECEENVNHSTETPGGVSYSGEQGHVEEEKEIPIDNYQVQGADLWVENTKSFSPTPIILQRFSGPHQKVRDYSVACNQVEGTDLLEESTKRSSPTPSCLPKPSGSDQHSRDISVVSNEVQGARDLTMHHNSSVGDFFEVEHDPLAEMAPLKTGLEIIDSRMKKKHQHANNKEVSTDDSGVLDNQQFMYVKPQLETLTDFSAEHLCLESIGFPEKSNAKLFKQFGYVKAQSEPLAEFSVDQLCSESKGFPENLNVELLEDSESKLTPSTLGIVAHASDNPVAQVDLMEEHPASTKRWTLQLNNFYDEVVHEMEEILLDYSESPGARFPQGHQMSQSLLSLPLRDGGSTASTSGADDAYPLTPLPLRIDGVEVVGAKQKKGGVSLSERLVGVKEYTVYKIKVCSGRDQWEVERRYRDFFTLYRRLKSLFAEQGQTLPSPWSSVEKESRKLFGNASPDVVAHRSVLIQECLQSVIYSSPPNALVRFLSPQESLPSSPASKTLLSWSTSFTRAADAENISTLGKTISLIVEIRPQKSMKQMLEAQHYTCAGCHKHFEDGMTLMRDFVQNFGWGKPRLCEYTGQLFCSSCHTNETTVLPAKVLHHWDFTQYPVSQLAKSYLDSVYDQPMLCVSAVNPFLYSKVPALHHVMGVRKKIGIMLPYIRCPFRRPINKGLGSRRYLLESNDFFALRDLIDLSKGPFAALPVMVENVSRKIQEHITEQCLVCCDVGVPCSARQACDDPSSLIFAFQEGEIERCKSCAAVFHKPCFRKLIHCQCGASLGLDEATNSGRRVSTNASVEANGALNLLGRRSSSGLSLGLLSGLFSKANPEKTERRGSNNVILMGSLPNTSL